MATLFNSPRYILVLGIVTLCFQSAFAHTYLSSVYLNNQLLAEGDCVRPHPQLRFDYPIPFVTSQEMTCGWLPDAARAANRKCPIAAGSKIGIQWHHNSNSPSDDIIEATHVGPINFYLARSDTGAGDVWFKIYEDGYKDGKWAVNRLLDNKGRVDVTIPSDIAPGNYLLRGEIFALHGAYIPDGIQPYIGCVELTISGSGSAKPSGVSFPGFYKNTDPGMIVSVYQPIVNYVIPGPRLYVPGSSSTSSSGSSTSSPTSTPTPTPSIAPTSRPTTTPTAAPSAGNIRVGLNANTNVWWVGVLVSGGAETTVKVELMDSGAVSSWTALVDMSYSYVYSAQDGVLLQPPFSLRLTSSSGKQVVLNNIFASLSTNGQLIDSGKTYSSSTPSPQPTTTPTTTPTTAPTTPPSTPKPTQAPTQTPSTPKPTVPATPAPTTPPSSGNGDNAKVTVFDSSSEWWFAVTISGADVAKVEIKDSASLVAYATMNKNDWGSQEVYAFEAQSSALVTPILVRVTSKSGKVEVASVTSIAGNAVFEASS